MGLQMEPHDSETNYRKLVSRIVSVIKSYRPNVMGVDTHAAECLGIREGVDPTPEQTFIKQVLYGCVRYRKVLKILLSSFYFNNSGTTNRGDYTMYMIYAYIGLYRLDELGFAEFEKFVQSQEPVKMHVFLSFCLNIDVLTKWVKAEWAKIIDVGYIEETLFGRIRRFEPQLNKLLSRLQAKAYGGNNSGVSEGDEDISKNRGKKFTTPEPFDLHKPRRVPLPQPHRIEQKKFTKPIPRSLNNITLAKIQKEDEERKKRNAEATAKKHAKAKAFTFQPNRTDINELRRKINAERDKHLQNKFKANPPPVFKPVAIPVRLNTAAILREDSVYRSKQEKEAALIHAYESELRDSTEFYKWQTKARLQDEADKLRLVDERRRATAASAKAAIEARAQVIQRNLEVSAAMNKELKEKRLKVIQEKEDEVKSKQALVKRVQKIRKVAPKRAAAKLLAEKKKRNLEDRKRQREIAAYKAAEAKKEQARREDMIRRIRALERTPKQRVTVFDRTTSSGIGLLEEVSIFEMKERLVVNAAREKEEENLRRSKIIAAREARKKDLAKRMKNISRIRKTAGIANRAARRRKKQEEKEEKAAEIRLREQQNAIISAKLRQQREARQAEQDRLDEEEARISKQRLLLGNDAKAMERKHFEEQLAGREREVKERQRMAQREAQRKKEVRRNDEKQRKRLALRQRREEKMRKKIREEGIEKARRYTSDRSFQEKKEKKELFVDAREDKAAALKAKAARNRYAATANQKSIARARAILKGK
eukprot:g5564.t1